MRGLDSYLTPPDPTLEMVGVECGADRGYYAVPLSAIAEDGSLRATPPGHVYKVVGECPWQGTLHVEVFQGEFEWQCPLCQTDHTGYVDDYLDDGPDPDEWRDRMIEEGRLR